MEQNTATKTSKIQSTRNSHTDDIYANCIRSYLEENRSLKDAIKALSSEVRKQKQINSQLTDRFSQSQQETQSHRKKFNKLKQENEELKNANEQLLKEANSRIDELNQELQESRKEVLELRQQIDKFKNSQQQMIMAHEDYAARLDQSMMELRRAKEEINISNDRIDKLTHLNASKDVQLSELSAACSSYDQKVRSLSSQLAFNDNKYTEQNSIISNLKQRIASLENMQNISANDKDAEIRQLRMALQKSEDKCQALTDALGHSQMQMQNMPINDREIQTLRDEHSVLLKRAEDAEECARHYEKELSEKSKQYTDTINKQNNNISVLTEKLRSTQDEKDRFQQIAQQIELQYSDLEQKVDNLSSKVNTMSISQSSPKRVSFPETEINLE